MRGKVIGYVTKNNQMLNYRIEMEGSAKKIDLKHNIPIKFNEIIKYAFVVIS